MNRLITRQMAKPVRPTIDFMTVQDFRVSETLMPKYRLAIQKPESLACEKAVPPQAIAMVHRASICGLAPSSSATGAVRLAPVIIATVPLGNAHDGGSREAAQYQGHVHCLHRIGQDLAYPRFDEHLAEHATGARDGRTWRMFVRRHWAPAIYASLCSAMMPSPWWCTFAIPCWSRMHGPPTSLHVTFLSSTRKPLSTRP